MGKRAKLSGSARGSTVGVQPPRLIACEQTGRWLVALRRELGEADCRLQETRTLGDCWEQLAEHPASFVVLELLAANVPAVLDRLTHRERQFPAACVAVVADRSLRDYEWLLREAGAVHFVTSPRMLGPLAAVARRHWSQRPEPRLNLAERIWAGLPWQRSDVPLPASWDDCRPQPRSEQP